MGNDTVYIKGDRNVEVRKRDVTLGDLVSLECSDPRKAVRLRVMKVLKIPEKGEHRFVVSVLKLISCIHKEYSGIEIQNIGETDIIVTYKEQKTPSKCLHLIKTVLVAAITFCGAAFSAMAFNNDVDVPKLFAQIYYQITGEVSDGCTILEVTYSAGLAIGILVFFNHFGKKRFSVDPTPIEVEMRLYENDIQTTLIENYARKGKEIDVGQTDTSGLSGS